LAFFRHLDKSEALSALGKLLLMGLLVLWQSLFLALFWFLKLNNGEFIQYIFQLP
jgi:hypothetical protein